MALNGYNAYKTAQTKGDDPRDTEYRLLAQATAALIKARDNPKDVKFRAENLFWNRSIWAALRTDLKSDYNQLPAELKKSLISLSIWVERETMDAMDGKTSLDALIEVNRNIMAGLKPESLKDEEGSSMKAENAMAGF